MIQHRENIEEITMENMIKNPELIRADLMNGDTDSGIKPKAIIIQSQEETTNTHTEKERSDARKDKEIINKCKLEIKRANNVMTNLEKDIKKLEALNQVITMVRRSLNRTSRNFWDSSL